MQNAEQQIGERLELVAVLEKHRPVVQSATGDFGSSCTDFS